MIAKTLKEADRQSALIERRRSILERWARPRVQRAYVEAGDKLAFLYEQGGGQRMAALQDEAAEILKDALDDIYYRVSTDFLGLALASGKSFHGWETKAEEEEIDEAYRLLLDEFRTYAFTMSKTITETMVSDVIGAILRDEELINAGPFEVSRAIRSQVGTLAPWKADMIARTEVFTAAAESQDKFTDAIWDEVEDGPLYVKWNANRGSRTRDDHRKMNGKIVPRGQKFKLPNGDELRYPSDRRARKVESVVNCRCSSSVLPEELVPEKYRSSQVESQTSEQASPRRLTLAEVAKKTTFKGIKKGPAEKLEAGVIDVFSKYNLDSPLDFLGAQEKRRQSMGVYRRALDNSFHAIEFQKSFANNAAKKTAENVANFNDSKKYRIERASRFLDSSKYPQSTVERNKDAVRKLQETKRWGVFADSSDPVSCVAWHEAGHAVYYVKNLAPKWDKYLREYKGLADAHKLSEYGSSDISELFAETVAAIEDGRESIVPDSILKAFREVME